MLKIYHSDCISIMQEMREKNIKVDHIITDPPYSISAKNQFNTMRNPRAGVDFGKWDWGFDPTGWIEYAMPILSDDGSIIIFCSYKFISDICKKIEELNGVVKDIIVWQKSNPMPRNINRRYVQDMEFIVWGVKSKNSKWVFNKDESKPYHRGFIQTPTLLGKERTKHPTQKPVSLMTELIKLHTTDKQTIFDPFMGVGSTGVAALNLGRNFIGCEKELEWFQLAQNRICE
ncbi:MAG: site-specific DNA-methyltransferase [Haemophilus parainfluenzae]|nr:site-specific DNA-methyltransferase [Haemophilus parainfluenzae]MDU4451183.1 site-specific DNA-methyltransferase [Haemophilus parainfluenzae]MDU4497651.1 site-specific DNA-methyltransferase [Haemophilus parainfluenzae]DAN81369.1 MAG TPA: adenine-specific methyltransferase [Caudoviricetes sp.]DAU84974.1 MAG TPA: adenine-specific methyltransferase [Caudoviricetes sp.]